uniref:Piezo-type mechanosensitive ion channel component n=1 Tax=Rhabditophanes sp. KR3021 TaxID=114890 RepID=A0AC35U6K3_9BILA
MVSIYVKYLFLWGILPISLVFAALIRPCFISIFYIISALICPTLLLSSTGKNPKLTNLITVSSLVGSVILLLLQVVFQITSAFVPSLYTVDCLHSASYYILGSVGYFPGKGSTGFDLARSFLPELVAFVANVITTLIVLLKNKDVADDFHNAVGQESYQMTDARLHNQNNDTFSKLKTASIALKMALQKVSEAAIVMYTAVISICRPSLLNAPYFLLFIAIITQWGLYSKISRLQLNGLKKFLIFYSAIHFLMLYLYQIEMVNDTYIGAWKQDKWNVIGIVSVFQTTCKDAFVLRPVAEFTVHFDYFGVLFYYFILMLQFHWTKSGIKNATSFYKDEDYDGNSSVHEDLLNENNASTEEVQQVRPQIKTMQRMTSRIMDRNKISSVFRKPGRKGPIGSEGIITIICFFLDHYYVIPLLSMMTYALIYHSVTGLIYLFIVCFLWAVGETRTYSLKASVFIVSFTELVIVTQYVYYMQIPLIFDYEWAKNEQEILSIIGFQNFTNSTQVFTGLLIKIGLSLPLFVLLRQYLREKYFDSIGEPIDNSRIDYGTFDHPVSQINWNAEESDVDRENMDKTTASKIVNTMTRLVTKFWIFIVALILLLASIDNVPTAFTVGFFVLWCIFIICLQTPLRTFRNLLFAYWTICIMYTSVVVLCVYIYQFTNIPEWFQTLTGIKAEWCEKIGLINYKSAHKSSLLKALFWPISFILVTVLQLKLFHDPWIKMTRCDGALSVQTTPLDEEVPQASTSTANCSSDSLSTKLISVWNELSEIFCRILELHLNKLLLLVIIIIAANDVTAINAVVVCLCSLAYIFPYFSMPITFLLGMYLSVAGSSKMIYQIAFVDQGLKNPLNEFANGTCDLNFTTNVTLPQYIGLVATDNGSNIAGIIWSLIGIAIVCVVRNRQIISRSKLGIEKPRHSLVFGNFDPRTYDSSLLNCAKFIIDYTFYKFGLEISFIAMAINAWQRMDFIGLLLMAFLFGFVFISRTKVKNLWLFFVGFMAIIVPTQYIMVLGLPQDLCYKYPWMYLVESTFPDINQIKLFRFFNLADYAKKIVPGNTVWDFLLLMIVSCQYKVFGREHENHPAGDNDTIYKTKPFELFRNNPHQDFITKTKSLVDYIKYGVFMYAQWFSLVMVFVAGLGGTSLFALGYVLLAFWMLWQGTKLYSIKNFTLTLKRWNILIAYNIFAMLFKIAIQFVACVLTNSLKDHCLVRQLFSIVCVYDAVLDPTETCVVPITEAKIGFDILCFGCLVFQHRILHSYYFQHCIVDFRCQMISSNRGAVLKNQLIEKQMKKQNDHESKKLTEIKEKTAAIRKRYEEQQTIGEASCFTPETYGQAKRSGDYYMFLHETSNETNDTTNNAAPEVDPGCTTAGITPIQLAYLAVDKDLQLKKTLDAVKSSEDIENDDDRISKAVQRKHDESHKSQEKSAVIVSGILFVLKFVEQGLSYVAAFLNRRTREHRYVSFVLNKENARLREELGDSLYDSKKTVSEIRKEWDKRKLYCVRSENDIVTMESLALTKWYDRNVVGRFLTAAGYCISAYTDILCYILAIIAHAQSGLITMPLPLMVFLWGSLASPRPSKLFWICMLAYTQLVIFLKFVVQFGTMGNEVATVYESEHTLGSFLLLSGLIKMSDYAFWDVFLLFALFFHRYNLRRLGLWKEANVNVTFLDNVSTSSSDNLSLEEGEGSHNQVIPNLDTSEESNMNCVVLFYTKLFNPKFRAIKDLYPYMFLMDVIAFFIVVFGYKYFGDGSTGNVISDISANRVPLAFALMMIVLSFMIVIDRGLYLRKAKYCKFAYQLITIVFLHIWLFGVLPKITTVQARANIAGKLLYIVKGIYLLISAWQIRNGYPVLCSGNLITHSYGLVNMVCFKVFQAVPFLYEIRTAIDWTWTDTSMPLFDYFNMENYYAVVYNLKCARTFENNYPAPRGEAKGTLIKYLMGLPTILILIFVIWCPLLAFALLNTIGLQLPPESVKMTIGIEGYPPLYSMQSNNINMFSLQEYSTLIDQVRTGHFPSKKSRVKTALAFTEDYTNEDIHKILFRPESENNWIISNQSLSALHKELNSTQAINLKINLEVTRTRQAPSAEPIRHTTTFTVSLPYDSEARRNLTDIMDSSKLAQNVTIQYALPEFINIPNEGQLSPAWQILNLFNGDKASNETFVNMSLAKTNGALSSAWKTQLHPTSVMAGLMPTINMTDYEGSEGAYYLQLIVFVNRVYPSIINKYISGGIIAMYIALVLMLHRLIRGMITNAPLDVIINEIPNPDFLLRICLDIYLVREAKDFVLEQDLFAKLIFLFRSPATLIEWTRYKVKTE